MSLLNIQNKYKIDWVIETQARSSSGPSARETLQVPPPGAVQQATGSKETLVSQTPSRYPINVFQRVEDVIGAPSPALRQNSKNLSVDSCGMCGC